MRGAPHCPFGPADIEFTAARPAAMGAYRCTYASGSVRQLSAWRARAIRSLSHWTAGVGLEGRGRYDAQAQRRPGLLIPGDRSERAGLRAVRGDAGAWTAL